METSQIATVRAKQRQDHHHREYPVASRPIMPSAGTACLSQSRITISADPGVSAAARWRRHQAAIVDRAVSARSTIDGNKGLLPNRPIGAEDLRKPPFGDARSTERPKAVAAAVLAKVAPPMKRDPAQDHQATAQGRSCCLTDLRRRREELQPWDRAKFRQDVKIGEEIGVAPLPGPCARSAAAAA